jgi:hypothetical protein
MQKLDRRLLFSLGIHSAAIIAFQLALMQLISVVQWHHFAYMIISVAMLGFGASGTLLALARDRLLRWSEWLVPLLMSVSGMFMMIAFHITRYSFFEFDAYLLFVEWSQFPVLLANYIIFFIPFFAGALAIGIIFIKYASVIGTWYFSNLLGSGLGGITFLLVFGYLLPQQMPPLTGLLSVLAGLLSLSRSKRILQVTVGMAAFTVAIVMIFRPSSIPLSEYKDLARTLNLPDAEIIYTRPDLHGLIQVVESPALRYAPALSLSFTEAVPVKKSVFVRGDFYGVIPLFHPNIHIHDHTTNALPYILGSRDRVLVLNAGTGISLSHALTRNASRIDAVIENRGIVELMRNTFAEESRHLFHHPSIYIHQQEARNYLASESAHAGFNRNASGSSNMHAGKQNQERGYDLILLPMQESFGGSAGINALREDYSMTLEAFSLMWDQLSDDGVIAVTTWLDYPSRASLKILASLVETVQRKGVDNPKDHIAAIRSWGTISFVLKRNPITSQEETLVREFASSKSFDPLLLPNLQPEERMQFNFLEDESLFQYMDEIMAGNALFSETYGFMISPASDDKPYFSQYLRLRSIRQMAEIFGQGQLPFLELGLLIVIVTLVQSTILAILFILLPLFKLRKSNRKKTGTLLYFAALGIGYMFVEIILIQRFVLYFGQPVYAISAVISTMLISSGGGSLISEKLKATPKVLAIMGGIITIMLVAYAFSLTQILQSSISQPLHWKILISLLVIGIPSFFKGMMFPIGIRHLSEYDQSQIPWAWGINGSVSVISTALATLIAVEAGFMAVMFVAVGCYLIATLVFVLYKWSFKRETCNKTM